MKICVLSSSFITFPSKQSTCAMCSKQNTNYDYNSLAQLLFITFKDIFQKKSINDVSVIAKMLLDLVSIVKNNLINENNLMLKKFHSLMIKKMEFDSYMYDEVNTPIGYIIIGLVAVNPNKLIELELVIPGWWDDYLKNNKYLCMTMIIESCVRHNCNISEVAQLLQKLSGNSQESIIKLINEAIFEYYNEEYKMLIVDWLNAEEACFETVFDNLSVVNKEFHYTPVLSNNIKNSTNKKIRYGILKLSSNIE